MILLLTIVLGDHMISKIMKFSLLMISIVLLLNIHPALSFGLTEPLPVGIRTARGDTQRFYFQIQNVDSDKEQTCNYDITGVDPILVSPSQGTVTLAAREIKNIYGTVSVPSNAEIKTYTGGLSVSCSVGGTVTGTGSTVISTGHARFFIDVLAAPEAGSSPYIPSVQPPTPTYNTGMIMIITIIIVLVVCIYFWSERKKK